MHNVCDCQHCDINALQLMTVMQSILASINISQRSITLLVVESFHLKLLSINCMYGIAK